MRIRGPGSISRYRWGIVAVILPVLVALMWFGTELLRNSRPPANETKKIIDAVTVTGYVRTGVLDMSGDHAHAFAEAYFIGPAPKPDALAVVSVPAIQLHAVATPPDPAPWEQGLPWDKGTRTYTVVAKGERPDGCAVGVSYVTDPKLPGYKLTPEQAEAVRSGAQIFITVSVSNCGA